MITGQFLSGVLHLYMCVCERERERERETQIFSMEYMVQTLCNENGTDILYMCVCVCVCVQALDDALKLKLVEIAIKREQLKSNYTQI